MRIYFDNQSGYKLYYRVIRTHFPRSSDEEVLIVLEAKPSCDDSVVIKSHRLEVV